MPRHGCSLHYLATMRGLVVLRMVVQTMILLLSSIGKMVISSVIMDSDACNSALKQSAATDAIEQEDHPQETEKGLEGEEEEGDAGVFKRNLRNPVSSFGTTASRSKSRDEYMKSRLAIQEGRHLTVNLFVEVEVEMETGKFFTSQSWLHR